MMDDNGVQGRKGVKWLKRLVIGGAVGSMVAFALGTKTGRKQAQDFVGKIIGKLGSREQIDKIVPLKSKKQKNL